MVAFKLQVVERSKDIGNCATAHERCIRQWCWDKESLESILKAKWVKRNGIAHWSEQEDMLEK